MTLVEEMEDEREGVREVSYKMWSGMEGRDVREREGLKEIRQEGERNGSEI